MNKTERRFAPGVPFETVMARHMKDPAFRRAYKELGPEFEIIKQIIDLRRKRKMSQAQLAKRIGTQQPSIARMEGRGQIKNLDYLQRVANALDARVVVHLVPLKASGARAGVRAASRARSNGRRAAKRV